VARSYYHPLATPSIDADLRRVYNPTFLLFTEVSGNEIPGSPRSLGPMPDAPLERLSKQMDCYVVAAMLEEPPSVACRHHVESSAHRLYAVAIRRWEKAGETRRGSG
jgi:hypothetical protein